MQCILYHWNCNVHVFDRWSKPPMFMSLVWFTSVYVLIWLIDIPCLWFWLTNDFVFDLIDEFMYLAWLQRNPLTKWIDQIKVWIGLCSSVFHTSTVTFIIFSHTIVCQLQEEFFRLSYAKYRLAAHQGPGPRAYFFSDMTASVSYFQSE